MAATAADKPCAICGKPQADPYRPFCSRRCADVDLNRWLSDGYAIPGRDGEAGSEGQPDSDNGPS